MFAKFLVIGSLFGAASLGLGEDPELTSKANSPAEAEVVEASPEDVLSAAVEGVQSFYNGVTDFKASFTQVVKRKHLPRPLKKSGTVFFKKPGMMRWDYTNPDRVYYISDGDVLWSYQTEDKLVYKIPVKDSELYGSLKFLFGQGNLKAEFKITLGEVKEDRISLELVPKVKQSNYKKLILHLKKDSHEIVETELVDPLDNVSRVTFSKVSYTTLKKEGFSFTPPKGVRVEDLQANR